MRKSNWFVVAILVAASILFLIMWNALGFNLVDAKDLWFTIIWWVVIVGVCVAIMIAENKRRQNARTAFLAPQLIYNPEVGIVKVESETDMVPELQRILSNLKYDMVKAEVPADSRIRFDYVVHTNRFAHDGDVWEGDLVKISRSNSPKPFRDREELTMLLEGAT